MTNLRPEVAEALLAYIHAESWDESRQVIEAHKQLLLTDEADTFLAISMMQFRERPDVYEMLRIHRDVLARCRELDDVGAAFAELETTLVRLSNMMDASPWDGLLNELSASEQQRLMVTDLINCESSNAVLKLVLEHPEILEEESLSFIKRTAEAARDRGGELGLRMHTSLEERLETLLEIRHHWARAYEEKDALFEILQNWINISDRALSEEFLQSHPELLTDRAETILQQSLEGAETAGERIAAHHIRHYFDLLVQSRKADIKFVFGESWDARRMTVLEFADPLARRSAELKETYERNGDVAILGEAIGTWEEIVYHRDFFFGPLRFQLWMLDHMAGLYLERYSAVGALEDLDRSLGMWRIALARISRGISNPERSMILSKVAYGLLTRYQALGRIHDLEEASQFGYQAFEYWSSESSVPSKFLASFGAVMLARYEVFSQPEDLEFAVELLQKGVKRDPNDSALLSSLGLALKVRYVELGNIGDLEEAIAVQRQALSRASHVAAEQASLTNLGAALVDRYTAIGELEDLDEAIKLYRRAIALIKVSSPDLVMSLTNLGVALRERYIDIGQLTDLLEAINVLDRALKVSSTNFRGLPIILTNLGLALKTRYEVLDRPEDLELAIATHRRAVERTPVDSANLHIYLNHLGHTLHERFYIQNEFKDLEDAVDALRAAYEASHEGSVNRPFILNNLGEALIDRFSIRGDPADMEMARRAFEEGLELLASLRHPEVRSRLAYNLGRLHYDQGSFYGAKEALLHAHRAIEEIRSGMTNTEGRRRLSGKNADMYARLVFCYLREGDIEAAFEYAAVAKGRAFVDALANARMDLTAAGADDPALATELQEARRLREEIDGLLAALLGASHDDEVGGRAGESVHRNVLLQQVETARRQEDVVWERIARRHPAFAAQVNAPSLRADEGRRLAAATGATLVEYYQHTEGWGAFVVTAEAMHYVPLIDVDDRLSFRSLLWLEHIEDRWGRGPLSYRFLERLYEALIAPLLHYIIPGKPVVLAPFGWLHLVPLAAARPGAEGVYLGQKYLLAFVPSLGALKVLWQEVGDRPPEPPRRLLAVAYPGEQGSLSYLPNVVPEAEAIGQCFTQLAADGSVTPLYDDAATPDAVIAKATGYDAVHFGCHGWFDGDDPLRSALLLAGGVLDGRRVLNELRLEGVTVAMLAACFSGRVGVDAGDNISGLLQALLLAGARVVGAGLWSVHDAAARYLFAHFYAALVRGAAPAEALQVARNSVRRQANWQHPYYWAGVQIYGMALGEPTAGVTEDLFAAVPKSQEETLVAAMNARGERKLDVEEIVDGARVLLQQMLLYPEEVVEALEPGERTLLVAVMGALMADAEEGALAGPLARAEVVYALVEEVPGLRNLLAPAELDLAQEQRARAIKPHNLTDEDREKLTEMEKKPVLDNEPPRIYEVYGGGSQEQPPENLLRAIQERLASPLWHRVQIELARLQRRKSEDDEQRA